MPQRRRDRSPERARAWLRVIRDGVIYAMATIILGVNVILYVTRSEPPNVTWIGAAVFLYGLAPALRADEWLLKDHGQAEIERSSG